MRDLSSTETLPIRLIATYQTMLRGRHRWDENLSQRAASFMPLLDLPPTGLKFRVAMARLRYQWDLLMEENTDVPGVLALQVKVFGLREASPVARYFAESSLTQAPMAKLFWAILQQAKKDGATSIRISFPDQLQKNVTVTNLVGEESKLGMTIPPPLARPLLGFIRRSKALGYRDTLAMVSSAELLPEDVEILQPEENIVLLRLS